MIRSLLAERRREAASDSVVVPAAGDTGSRGWNGGDWPVVVSRLDALAAASFSVPEDVCPDTTLLLRAPDGTQRELRVPYFVDLGPNSGYIGELPVQMVDAGRWLLTGIRSGTGSAAAEPPRQFWVLQKVVVSLDHLPVVAAGAAGARDRRKHPAVRR